jgi:hypothetical protein
MSLCRWRLAEYLTMICQFITTCRGIAAISLVQGRNIEAKRRPEDGVSAATSTRALPDIAGDAKSRRARAPATDQTPGAVRIVPDDKPETMDESEYLKPLADPAPFVVTAIAVDDEPTALVSSEKPAEIYDAEELMDNPERSRRMLRCFKGWFLLTCLGIIIGCGIPIGIIIPTRYDQYSTEAPTTAPVSDNNIYTGSVEGTLDLSPVVASEVDEPTLAAWENLTKQWFEDSFNRNTSFKQPFHMNISNMSADFQVTDTDASDGLFFIYFNQTLSFKSTNGPIPFDDVSRGLFENDDMNFFYRQILRDGIKAFERIESTDAYVFSHNGTIMYAPPSWQKILGLTLGGLFIFVILVLLVRRC